MGQPNYLTQNAIEYDKIDDVEDIIAFNNTGSTLTAGTTVMICEGVVSGQNLVAQMIAPATSAIQLQKIGVVMTDTLTATYGRVRLRGVVGDTTLLTGAKTTSTIAANDQLKATNAGTAFAAVSTGSSVGGAAIGTTTAAIAIVNVTTNVWKVYLLGRPVTI